MTGRAARKGGRLSYVAGAGGRGGADPTNFTGPGETYVMPIGEYHETPNSGVVVTLLEKLAEGNVHASSLIETGHPFDQDFDRFQLSDDDMWSIVTDALRGAA